jgi:hypothetical protein
MRVNGLRPINRVIKRKETSLVDTPGRYAMIAMIV